MNMGKWLAIILFSQNPNFETQSVEDILMKGVCGFA
jgi:hypothetical protein